MNTIIELPKQINACALLRDELYAQNFLALIDSTSRLNFPTLPGKAVLIPIVLNLSSCVVIFGHQSTDWPRQEHLNADHGTYNSIKSFVSLFKSKFAVY